MKSMNILKALFVAIFLLSLNINSTYASQQIVVGANLKEYKPPTQKECNINVPGEYTTIQLAINAAVAGDTICVAAGIYDEKFEINKPVRVSGAGATHPSLMNGKGASGGNVNRHVSIVNGLHPSPSVYITSNNAVLEGFVINGPSTGWGGVAVYVAHTVSSGVVIRDNYIRSGSGSGALRGSGIELVNNNFFEGNDTPHLVITSGTQVLNNSFIGTVNRIDRQDTGIALADRGRGGKVAYNVFDVTGDVYVLVAIRNEFGEAVVNFNNLNTASYHKVATSWSWPTLNAENNWWGDTDPSDDIQGPVDYSPFATEPFKQKQHSF